MMLKKRLAITGTKNLIQQSLTLKSYQTLLCIIQDAYLLLLVIHYSNNQMMLLHWTMPLLMKKVPLKPGGKL